MWTRDLWSLAKYSRCRMGLLLAQLGANPFDIWNYEGKGMWLTAAPVDGAANEALVALLAERLGVPKRQVVIVRGATSRQKVVEIVDVSLEDLKLKLAQ